MRADTLTTLQNTLAQIYDLPATPDVLQFLLTDRACIAGLGVARASDEQLIVAQQDDMLSLGLYIDAQVLERLARSDPCASLTQHNLADYLTVAEGVSHFVYVAWSATFDKPVTLLELELQAEVDKYVLCAWLLREQGAGRFPRELHRALFEKVRIDPLAAAGRTVLYQTAGDYARRFCRRVAASLARGTDSARRDLLTELRRFYRWSQAHKLRHIERFA